MKVSDHTLVILAGGRSTRYKNDFYNTPKVLSLIGGKPILWHIIKHYQYYGVKHVILALGYEHQLINDTMMGLFQNEPINIDCVFTGDVTPTGGRICGIKNYLKSDSFFVTYGDGLSSVQIDEQLAFHYKHNKIATVTVVKRHSPFGHITMNSENSVLSFEEKPMLPFWTNAGFLTFNQKIFDFLNPDSVIETTLFNQLIIEKSLIAFKHNGFWKCMDTFKESLEFEEIWQKGQQEWKVI